MANTHFINAGTETIEGQGVVDVQWEAPSPTRQLATMFPDVETTFTIPPNAGYTHDETCTSQLDMPLIMFGNHMRGYGQSVLSEVVHADGTKHTLANDSTWSAEQEFNPTFTQYPIDAPHMIHAGDVVHASCTWQKNDAVRAHVPRRDVCRRRLLPRADRHGRPGDPLHRQRVAVGRLTHEQGGRPHPSSHRGRNKAPFGGAIETRWRESKSGRTIAPP